MTDLDLPQVSFARYLELLKRRWWSVIPVTLGGLIVGAITAFLIPRYYVAETDFYFRGGAALDDDPLEDPMLAVARNAESVIPTVTEDVLLALGWLEATDQDEERRGNFVESVKDRLEVQYLSGVSGAAPIVNLRIVYKDRDGYRAMEFANAIRDTWIEQEKERIERQAFEELDDVNNRLAQARKALNQSQTELRNFQEINRIDVSQFDVDPRIGITRDPARGERSGLSVELTLIIGQIARHETYIEELNAEFNNQSIPHKVTEVVPAPFDPEAAAELAELHQRFQRAQAELKTWAEGSPRHAFAKVEYDRVVVELAAARQRRGPPVVAVENQFWLEKKSELATHRAALAAAKQQRDAIRLRLDQLNARAAEMPGLLQQHFEFVAKKRLLLDDVDALDDERREKHGRYVALKRRPQFRTLANAEVPPVPTDPNIALVAFAGSLIGLATAIGLILLLDAMQSSFKTLDDVQRGLPVPVLGQLAHLETFEERTKTAAHRRRVSLAATVFLFLSFSVVTVYFVDPTRLPPFVATLFDVILGSPEPR